LYLSLGLLAGRGAAEELQWRPAAAPVADNAAPAAMLGKPVAARATTTASDPAVRTVSFSTTDSAPTEPTFRLQMPDIPKPMPGANGKQKTSDKSSDLPAPREMRETIGPSFPPPPSPVNPVSPVPSDPGDFCVPSDCGGPSCCADGCCGWGGCCNQGDGHLWWFTAEYLLWWTKNGPAPVLVTTGPPSTFGVLGAAGTVALFGGPIDYGTASGGRFSTGLWFCECQNFGIDASFFFLGTQSANFFAASDSTGSPVLSRPFTGAITGVQTVEQIAFPGEQAGSVAVHSTSRLLGADTNLLWNPCCLSGCGPCGGTWRWGFLGGFRYLNLKESLGISEDFTDLGTVVTRHQLTDSFNTSNNFYGGQLGTMLTLKRGPWSIDVKTKVALGSTNQSVHISGSEVDTSLNTGAQVRFNSGLLALPTNSGRFGRNVFSVVPEVGVNIGYQVCENLRLFVGYDFLFWSNVARPGAQIDTTLNTTQQSGGTLVGPARPAFAFHNSDYWAQGINFGLELRY
jgi:hypothetical protein